MVEAEKASGPFIQRGMSVSQLDLTRKWKAEFLVKKGDFAEAGTKVAKVQETDAVVHFVMVPPTYGGKLFMSHLTVSIRLPIQL